MHVAPYSVFLPPYHKRDLTVGLQAYQSIDHMAARLLQHSGPDDVVLLVKAGLQLHQHRHLLAVLSGQRQSGDDGRIAADPVQCLLDGQHLRISGRLTDELHHGLKGLIWMVQQNIPLADLVEDHTAHWQPGHLLGNELQRLQMLEALQTVHLHQHGQIQRPLYDINVLLLYVQLLPQNL